MKNKVTKILSLFLAVILTISITDKVLALEDAFPELQNTPTLGESDKDLQENPDKDLQENPDEDLQENSDKDSQEDSQEQKSNETQPAYENSIRGTIWLDLNEDGIHDNEEPAIANYPVQLYNSDSLSATIKNVFSDANGDYSFENITPGSYVLGVNPNELDLDKYLLPLIGISGDNCFAIDTATWLSAVTNTIEVDEYTVITEINAGMRNAPIADPMDVDSEDVIDENTLRAAVANAEPGATITLQNDITLTDGPLIITADKSITLNGGKKLFGADGEYVICVLGKLTIADITVKHHESDTGNGIHVSGGGSLNVAGGEVSSSDAYGAAIYADNGDVIISGGEVSASDEYGMAIYADNGDITISGGKLSVYGYYGMAVEVDTGNVTMTGGEIIAYDIHNYGISINVSGTIKITGGKVIDSAEYFTAFTGIQLSSNGIAAYLTGTCEGELATFSNTIIVEVSTLDIPASYGGTSTDITRKAGKDISTVKWDTSEVAPRISFNSGEYMITWAADETEPDIPTDKPVTIRETNDTYETVSAAISAAGIAGLDTFTLEISGDVAETSNIVIASNKTVTIVGVAGAHTIAMDDFKILVQGGALTLGDGTETDLLTIGAVRVTSGTVNVKDGISLVGNIALQLNSSGASGAISGGRLTGTTAALDLSNGAQLSEISGGIFNGKTDTVHLSDAGTKIHSFSGGVFYQTDETTTLHGHTIFVQNLAEIGEISGGYFDAVRSSALVLTRGGKVGEISGGVFVAQRVGVYDSDPNKDTRNAAVAIKNYENDAESGIGVISGGRFNGTNFGILLVGFKSTCHINEITGGIIEGTVGLQNDYGATINEISGGTISGVQGILNVGIIKSITGQVDIQGLGSTNAYGIFNYSGGQIFEISGGTIIGEQQCLANQGTVNLISGGTIISQKSAGITNSGTITKISGGTIIGDTYSIYCFDTNGRGTIETISGGVFLGKNATAIYLVSSLTLEPGLESDIGNGRYWGKNGNIFNNESLVNYPINQQKNVSYFMSTETLSVSDISNCEFKYLKMPTTEYLVTVNGSYATITGAGFYEQGATVTINAGTRIGYTFIGWITDDGVIFDDATRATTYFTMPDDNVTVTALWKQDKAKPDDVPKTQDANATTHFISLLLGSLFIAVTAVMKLKKHRN